MSVIMTQKLCNGKSKMFNLHTILLTIFSLMLIYDIYFTTKPTVVRIENPKFSLLGPYNTTQVKSNDVYDQLIDIKNFSFKINPQPCKDYIGGLLLLIIVSSNPSNYENRVVIRNTWGKSVDSTKVLFLLGETSNSTLSKKIQHESNIFGDIVQGTFTDAYRNMTYKHVMGLKWVTHYCPMAKYVLKTDDDIVVHSREMRRFLAKDLSPWGARGLIACRVLEHAVTQRLDSKWKVTIAEYALDHYPTYCAGWAILYSQDVVSRLLEAAQYTPYFWIDDVHITGIVAQEIGIARTSMTGLSLTLTKARMLQNFGPKYYVGQFVFGPPDLSPDEIVKIWKAIPA